MYVSHKTYLKTVKKGFVDLLQQLRQDSYKNTDSYKNADSYQSSALCWTGLFWFMPSLCSNITNGGYVMSKNLNEILSD